MQGIQQHRIATRLLESLPDYTSLALVILGGFLTARLVWSFFPQNDLPLTPNSNNTATVAEEGAPEADSLANYHLFGNAAVTPPPRQAAPIQNSQLALKLQGVYTRSSTHGYAFIEEGGKQQVYALGEAIGNSGATLEKVFADYVLIRYNNALQKLTLPAFSKSPAGGVGLPPPPSFDAMQDMPDTESDPSVDMVEQDIMPEPELQSPGASPGTVPPPLPQMNNASEPNGANGESMGNAPMDMPGASSQGSGANTSKASLLEVVNAQPYERDGKFIGYQLTPGSNVAMFNQYGLQSGDIATAVNGTVLDSPATAMQALQAASTASQVNLTLLRNGQEINLPINF